MPPMSQRAMRNQERDINALNLRKAGASYTEIAQQCGFNSKQAAFHAVQTLLKRTEREPADELRTLENERLDRMQLALWKQALAGNQGAIDRVIRLMERRARLNGLDAPTKQEVTGADGGPLAIILDR